jgi:hypothetical protein
VPGTMSLEARGYGKKKGIASSMIAAGTFDDILCIIIFGIVSTIAFMGVEGASGEGKKSNPGKDIGMIIVEILTGLGVGILTGLCSWFFKFIPPSFKYIMWAKAVWCITMATLFVIIS